MVDNSGAGPQLQRAGVLLVDDDEALLSAMKRLLRPDGLQVTTATSGEQALAILEEQADTFGAVISDYAMPGMTGADLLRAVRLRWPDLRRVLATGNADLTAAARAVNEGQPSHLVTKPWQPEHFRDLVVEVLDQHCLVVENRRLRSLADEQSASLERQAARLEHWNNRLEEQVAARTSELDVANANLQRGLLDTVRLLVGFLERRVPERAARSKEIARLVGQLAERAGRSTADVRRMQLGALVHDVGLLALPEALTRSAPENLPASGFLLYKHHAAIAYDMLQTVDQLSDIASWVRSHHERWDGSGYPDRLAGAAIPLASRLIALADGYLDAAELERGGTAATWRRKQPTAGVYDPDLVELLNELLDPRARDAAVGRMQPQNLRPGMVLDEEIRTSAGAVLLKAGLVLMADQITRIQTMASGGALASETVAIQIVAA